MTKIQNPILPGFNPDPSILRVGDDYYIATSTFEWFPGVQIHHSKDLVSWRLLHRPLNRPSQLNMLGEPDSCGVWAPCLTYSDGLFWLIFTDVKRFDGNYKDSHNYLVTCDSIDGEWSDPVYMNSSGFDPSLFHDVDGKKWFVNMVWDHRSDRTFFGGTYLQEYNPVEKKLVGPITNIFKGSQLGLTEGPHLYKRDDYYYLLTAEGGTGYEHAMTMARSKSLTGPYELMPGDHMITASKNPEARLQRAGHGDWVETQNGECYAVHLCSRSIPNCGKSPMGRETAIQKVRWNDDGWLVKANGIVSPDLQVDRPDLPLHPWPTAPSKTVFLPAGLPIDFQWLRSPFPEQLFSLTERPGYLRLKGRESLGSWYNQALVARRQQAFQYIAITCVSFEPDNFQQMAGLVCYYNTHKFHYLFIGFDEEHGRHIGVMSCLADQGSWLKMPLQDKVADYTLPEGDIYLKVDVDYEQLVFSWSSNGDAWHMLPLELDATVLSDEAGKGAGANFTGAFVGMAAQDVSGSQKHADFAYFEYQERD